MKTRFLAQFQVIAFVATASIPQAHADSATWNGNAVDALSLWSDVNNWDGPPAAVPGTGNTATFNTAGSNNDVINLGGGVSISSIIFDTSAVAPYTIGAVPIGSQTLTLEDSGSIIANSGIEANQIINANVTLGADGSAQSYAVNNSDTNNTITFAAAVTGGPGGVAGAKTININANSGVNFNGIISNGGATSLGIIKTGSGVLTLNTVAHTFSGGLVLEAGTLNIGSSGSANNSTISLGAAGQTGATVKIGVINSGTNPTSPIIVVDQTSGTATTRLLGTSASTSGQWSGPITMNENFTVGAFNTNAANVYNFTLNSTATVNLGANTLTLSSTSPGNVIAKGKISGTGNVIANTTNTGLAIIEGVTHDYTGTTNVTAGTLQIGGGSAGAINSSTIMLGSAGEIGTSVRLGVAHASTNPTSPVTVVDQTSGTPTTRILGPSSTTTGQWNGPITMNEDFTVTTAAATFTLNTGATVNLNANTLTLSNTSATSGANLLAKGIISGSGNLVVSNTSTGAPTVGLLALEGDNDFTGTTTISAGTLLVGNGGATGSIASTSSILNSGILDYKRTGTLNQGGPISGTGLVRVTGSGTVTFDKTNTYSGTTTIGGAGKITVATGGSIAPTTGNSLALGNSGSAGTLQYDSAATSKFTGITVGNGTTSPGTLNQTAGTINATSMTLNSGHSGTGIGTVNLSGGNLKLSAGNISASSSTAADGIYSQINVSGTGALTAGLVYLTGSPSAGRFGAGRVVQSGGSVTLSTGLTMARTTALNTAARRGEYNLSGGILTVPVIDQHVGADTFGTFNFNGGTLIPTANSVTFMTGLTTANVYGGGAVIDTNGKDITIGQALQTTNDQGVTTVTSLVGGTGWALSSSNLPVTFSTPTGANPRTATGFAVTNGTGNVTSIVVNDPGNGYTSAPTFTITGSGSGTSGTVNIGLPTGITLTGGGLTKSGIGTLTLSGANTYTGNTTVSAGTLSLGQINPSNEASTVSIAGAAFLDLGFGGIDTVDKLFINGVQQAAGDYTSAHVSGRFTGGGTLRVTTGPVAGGYASWIGGFGLAVGDQDPTDDPDNDGMNNLLEFVLNGNPSSSDPSIMPQLVVTATHFEFTYQRRDDSVSPETTQTFQWGTTLATWPGSVSISPLVASPPAAVSVTAGTPSDAVTDTVKISIPKTEAGGSGKLFGRLQVVKNP